MRRIQRLRFIVAGWEGTASSRHVQLILVALVSIRCRPQPGRPRCRPAGGGSSSAPASVAAHALPLTSRRWQGWCANKAKQISPAASPFNFAQSNSANYSSRWFNGTRSTLLFSTENWHRHLRNENSVGFGVVQTAVNVRHAASSWRPPYGNRTWYEAVAWPLTQRHGGCLWNLILFGFFFALAPMLFRPTDVLSAGRDQ